MNVYQPLKIFTNSVYTLLVLSILLVIASAGITYYNTQEKERSTKIIIRRYQSIQSAIQLLSLIKDMETGQRGYVITGDSSFLAPYNVANFNIKKQIDSLNYLINDNEAQTELLKEKINTTINNKIKDIKNSINIVNTFGRDSASKRVNTRHGQAHMDTLRILIENLIQSERELALKENQNLEKNTRIEDSIRFFSFTLIGLTSLVALVSLIRKQKSINELISSLQKSNEELEQRVLERTKQLIEANKTKDHFLGIASHDLKVPIAGILGLIELLNLENKERPKQEIQYLNYMQDSCVNMQRLISNLLDINRIEQGDVIKKEEINLKNILIKIEREFLYQAEKKNIKLIINIVDRVIISDQDALCRILENLLSNALKFSPSDRTVKLVTTYNDNIIRFDIIDQGPGITQEDMPMLFRKFQKLLNQPTGNEGSTGLGLSIVKELATLLDGEITVTSKVGKGTTFSLIIPSNPKY